MSDKQSSYTTSDTGQHIRQLIVLVRPEVEGELVESEIVLACGSGCANSLSKANTGSVHGSNIAKRGVAVSLLQSPHGSQVG